MIGIIWKRELMGYLHSLIAYLSIGIFLLAMGLFTWIFPDTSVLDTGYANLEPLFSIAPYVLLFLIPAITMRAFSEEKKQGTLELIFTKPIRDFQVVLGKYLASLTLIFLALLPTCVYYYSIYQLGSPQGNIDTAAFVGSFLGLMFLCSSFTAIGIFASSWSDNQIVSFLVSMLLCFAFYDGITYVSALDVWGSASQTVQQFGMAYHFDALSRGLVDSRDVLYFLSLALGFNLASLLVLQSRTWNPENPQVKIWSKKQTDLYQFGLTLLSIVFINLIALSFFVRIDLTEDKRYTLKDASKKILQGLDQKVFIEIYLDGDLPPGFQRLKESILETIQELDIASRESIQYRLINPSAETDAQKKQALFQSIAQSGIQPTNVFAKEKDQSSEMLLFPGALLSYHDQTIPINFLKGSTGANPEEVLNQSLEGVEFEITRAIQKLNTLEKKTIGYLVGQGELQGPNIADFKKSVSDKYNWVEMDPSKDDLNRADLILLAKPQSAFQETTKLKIDQYLVKGGKAIFLLDPVAVKTDSAKGGKTMAYPMGNSLDDLLFRYGVRINPDLVQDYVLAGRIPVVVGYTGDQPNMQLIPWMYYPLPNLFATHPATKNLSAIYTKYASSIDTVRADGIRKTALIQTSPYSKTIATPKEISFDEMKAEPEPASFQGGKIALAYLLEGKFTSLYKNRLSATEMSQIDFKEQDKPGQLVVVSDGDIIRNEFDPKTGEIYPLEFDRYLRKNFSNKDFLLNICDYLLDPEGAIQSRSKEVTLRPLDKIKIKEDKLYWQWVNVIAPLLILMVVGITLPYLRKRKYGSV